MLEGGSEVFTSALEEKVVDKLMLFIAPKLIGGNKAKTWFEGKGANAILSCIKLKKVNSRQIGEDVLAEGYLNNYK
jgi:diaminohydroxyphosphoribosylaminopyrimidine deaminase/5-amino-6-(5-phosphoribosylamino)uracil reductase